jgi:hypothetical protein
MGIHVLVSFLRTRIRIIGDLEGWGSDINKSEDQFTILQTHHDETICRRLRMPGGFPVASVGIDNRVPLRNVLACI